MNTETTFFEALIASLNQQRSTLPNSGQKPLCDVILRCGGIATQAHSSVLVALSTFFARILTNRKSTSQVHIYVGLLLSCIDGSVSNRIIRFFGSGKLY